MPVSPKKSQGFTLIEVIAAFTIMALTFAAILQILSNSTRQTIKSSERTRIALLAQSKMDELGLSIPVEESSLSGSFDDGVDWSMDITPYEIQYEGDISLEFAPVELYRVDLTISWFSGRDNSASMVFTTLRAMTPGFGETR